MVEKDNNECGGIWLEFYLSFVLLFIINKVNYLSKLFVMESPVKKSQFNVFWRAKYSDKVKIDQYSEQAQKIKREMIGQNMFLLEKNNTAPDLTCSYYIIKSKETV